MFSWWKAGGELLGQGDRLAKNLTPELHRPQVVWRDVYRVICAKSAPVPMHVDDALATCHPQQKPAALRMNEVAEPRLCLSQLGKCCDGYVGHLPEISVPVALFVQVGTAKSQLCHRKLFDKYHFEGF